MLDRKKKNRNVVIETDQTVTVEVKMIEGIIYLGAISLEVKHEEMWTYLSPIIPILRWRVRLYGSVSKIGASWHNSRVAI